MRISNSVAALCMRVAKTAAITLVVVSFLILVGKAYPGSAVPGTTYLGGASDGSDLLRVAVMADGGTNLQKYNASGNCALSPGAEGSCWTRQFFTEDGNGLVLYANGRVMFWGGNNEANFEEQSENVAISVGNSVEADGAESIVRTWTGSGVATGITINETISLAKGALEYGRRVEIMNATGAPLSDVRLIVGGDTQFMGVDNGYTGVTVADGNTEIYAYSDGILGSMAMSGTGGSAADRYFGGEFNMGRIMAKEEAWLGNEVSGPSEGVDTAYYLQWGDGTRSIATDATWTVNMREVLRNTVETNIQVAAPSASVRTVTPGQTVGLNFTVTNLSGEPIDLAGVSVTSQRGYTTTVDPTSAVVNYGTPVIITVSVDVPETAEDGDTDRITLTVPFFGNSNGVETNYVDLVADEEPGDGEPGDGDPGDGDPGDGEPVEPGDGSGGENEPEVPNTGFGAIAGWFGGNDGENGMMVLGAIGVVVLIGGLAWMRSRAGKKLTLGD